MKSYSAIIFDMDGVIIDSEPLHERAYLELFEETSTTTLAAPTKPSSKISSPNTNPPSPSNTSAT
jgi:beta-phosphoglucomutase-like phosphatase (HAD superfamily)